MIALRIGSKLGITAGLGVLLIAGMMINSSRAILYATPEGNEDFADAARRVALQTRDEINRNR